MANCNTCSDANTCTKCATGKFLKQDTTPDTCVDACPAGSYTYGSLGDGTDTCPLCTATMDNCATCSDENTCTKCSATFKINANTSPDTCESSCPAGTYQSGVLDDGSD